MANIFGALDAANHIQQQGEVGRQQGERSYLGRLMGQAIEAPPEQRTGLFALMARTSPDVALAAESHFTNRDAAQQERMAAELRNRAGILRQLPPEQRAIGWQRMAPDVAKLTNMPELANMPYDPATFDPVLDQIAGISAQQREGKVVGNNLVDPVTGKVIYEGPQMPVNAQIVAIPDGSGGTVSMMFDPRTRQLSDLPLGGAQAPALQGGSVAAAPADPLGVLSGISTLSNVPGVQTTSLHRDPANNARVGGVTNSQHMQGTAGDFVVPAAIKPAFMAQARALGFEAIDEGDHVHVELPFGARGGQMPRMGYNPPKVANDGPTVMLTPAEVEAMGFPKGSVIQRRPDGSLVKVHSPTERDTNGGKALPGHVVNQLTADAEKLNTLTDLQGSFRPDYAGNVVGGSVENFLGRLGGERVGVSTQGQATWWQQYDRYKNVIRNELFGSALTPSEQAAFEAADITPNMDPGVIKSNLGRQAALVQSALARRAAVWEAQGYNPSAVTAATRAGAMPGAKRAEEMSDDELMQALKL